MENIFQPNDKFDFSQISLANPTGIQGGAYFTRIQMHNKPLYIETPKSLTKQGFIKNGKKIYCDLMFDNNDEQFIRWLESLETTCQELIYKKGSSWFANELEKNDIEGAFASPMRVYKSGKYYLVRVNVKVNYATNTPSVKIYNEGELPITIEDVAPENYIISILEVQGIKFTSRNFQIEMELKQSMVLSSEKIFESCLIKTNFKNNNKLPENNDESENIILKINTSENLEETPSQEVLEETETETETQNDNKNEVETEKEQQEPEQEQEQEVSFSEPQPNDSDELDLKEVDLTSDLENLETITLKKPNQVYYEIYKAARKKAKEAKKQAISAFLEAKNIKKTYMLDDLDDSDDSEDSDMDIDELSEFSESDLEKEE